VQPAAASTVIVGVEKQRWSMHAQARLRGSIHIWKNVMRSNMSLIHHGRSNMWQLCNFTIKSLVCVIKFETVCVRLTYVAVSAVKNAEKMKKCWKRNLLKAGLRMTTMKWDNDCLTKNQYDDSKFISVGEYFEFKLNLQLLSKNCVYEVFSTRTLLYTWALHVHEIYSSCGVSIVDNQLNPTDKHISCVRWTIAADAAAACCFCDSRVQPFDESDIATHDCIPRVQTLHRTKTYLSTHRGVSLWRTMHAPFHQDLWIKHFMTALFIYLTGIQWKRYLAIDDKL
jgi:hypothetical protein